MAGLCVLRYSGAMVVRSIDEMRQFAESFLKSLTPRAEATVVGLYGDLGAGKTAFVQAVAQVMGVGEHVTSPTFVLMKRYGRLVHIDAYRIENAEELRRLGWNELAKDPGNIIMIEWADRVEELLPPDALRLDFTHVDEKTRKIETRTA